MASARKLPSGNWRVNLYIGKDETGKRMYKSFTGPDKKSAEAEAALYNLTRQEKPRSRLTVKDAIEQYITAHENVLSPSTIRAYRANQRNNFDLINAVRLEDLTDEKAQTFVNALAKDHSPKTVKNVFGLLSAAYAQHMRGVKLRVDFPRKPKQEMKIPTDDQVSSLIAALSDHPYIQTAVLLAATLGLRRGEICALTWGDVQGDRLFVTKALAMTSKNEWIEKAPKTPSGVRVLSLPPSLQAQLRSIHPAGADPADRILGLTPNQLTDAFEAVKHRLGYSFRLHDLRHYNASVMLAIGIPDKYAMQRMGHSTPDMLHRVYQHLMENTSREVDDKMAAYMSRFDSHATRNATRSRKSPVK